MTVAAAFPAIAATAAAAAPPAASAAFRAIASRFAIGLTISSGLAIGTMFTLLVVPAFYLLLARNHAADREAAAAQAYAEAVAE